MKDGDIKGLKSHDFHVMMQNIFPLCMQHLMVKGCRMAIIHLSHVFKKLCAKILDPTIMAELKNDWVVTLVLLEKEFPPFFNTMTHPLVHLV
jgi:hypothetical protein